MGSDGHGKVKGVAGPNSRIAGGRKKRRQKKNNDDQQFERWGGGKSGGAQFLELLGGPKKQRPQNGCRVINGCRPG